MEKISRDELATTALNNQFQISGDFDKDVLILAKQRALDSMRDFPTDIQAALLPKKIEIGREEAQKMVQVEYDRRAAENRRATLDMTHTNNAEALARAAQNRKVVDLETYRATLKGINTVERPIEIRPETSVSRGDVLRQTQVAGG